MSKGRELDKQIYEEGEPNWGCKEGWLDVKDVKEKIQNARDRLISDNTILGIKSKSDEISGYSATINWLIDKVFKEEFGNKLTGEENEH